MNIKESENREEAKGLESYPMLPLRGMLVYPHMVTHLDVGRDKSLKAVDTSMEGDHYIFLTAQRDPSEENPELDGIYPIGVVAEIKQLLRLPGTTVRVLVEGLYRARLVDFSEDEKGAYTGIVEKLETIKVDDDLEEEALMRAALRDFEEYSRVSRRISADTLAIVENITEGDQLADIISSHLTLDMESAIKVLETVDVKERLNLICEILLKEIEIAELEKKIAERVKGQIDKSQKEYYLREQIKAIQQELDDKEDSETEYEQLMAQLEEAKMPDEAYEKTKKEIERLYRTPGNMAEANVIRNYIDWMLALPWHEKSKDRLDLQKAEKILNDDHYGLEKPKERILEYLAVRKMTKGAKGPIICLVGPPGTGKTSLAKSVAKSLNKKFVRFSLGGLHDEAEIRGHRKTYIGAMPGRIIQSMKKAGTINPVILLDEIDKVGMDYKGDPSAALLEVLDPEQNNTFSDNYIEVPYNLSQVLFITTANVEHTIPQPLRDRMEVIQVSSYTELEKREIAMRHLVPKQLKENGLEKHKVEIKADAVMKIITEYTREPGVRSLERNLGTLCRKAAKDLLSGAKEIIIDAVKVEEYLGIPKYRSSKMAEKSEKGLVMGLAVTSVGGDVLPVEAALMPGTGKIHLTGQLGDVMKESASAGLTWLKSRAEEFNIPKNLDKEYDIHIHCPEGAIPKDGPSAGVTMVTALASLFLDRPVRKDIAMTGEVTIRGNVLPIGGVKEKVLAAHRTGIRTVILPKDNEKDLEDVPKEVAEEMTFVLAEKLPDVLKVALEKKDEN